MLSPDRNEPPTRSRTWMAVAASVAALALVGGLIVAANRDSDDDVPADQPPVTVPDTTGVDGETAPVPNPEQTVEQDPAPEAPAAVDPDPIVEQAPETDPVVELPTEGILSARCPTGVFNENDDGTSIGTQTCLIEADPLPVAAQGRNTLTIYPAQPETPQLFISAGYTLPDGSVRYSSREPGVDDFAGETIYVLGRRAAGGDDVPAISDWTSFAYNAPLPTTEEGGISAEVRVTCTPTFLSEEDIDFACTFTGDDARFVPEPFVIRSRTFTNDPDTPLGGNRPAWPTVTPTSRARSAARSTPPSEHS